ncbi:MAG: sugar ABC transporter permease [Oscillospiraceae bacterium]|nr:sugar ABC transporter permease [Oscillospiraceae bacterium]
MVAPTIIGLFVLNIWPFIQTIYTSFCEHLGFGRYKFIGIQNYVDMFSNTEFWKATGNTVWFCVLTVPLGMVLALFVAMLLNTKVKFKGGFRTIFFLPLVCAPAAIAMVWQVIFNGDNGILNQILGTNIQWITNPKTAVLAVAIVSVWSSVGYDAVLLLAGLQNIPKTLYEANSIDGAGKIRQFFTITLPMISPSLFSVLIMRLMASMKVYDLIYMMSDDTNPAMADMQSLLYLFYRSSFVAGDRGYGSAIVIWTVSLILLVTLIQFWGQKKWVTYDI